ncbi:MAG: hypothetical protein ACR2NA_12375 [Solirubrobacterales bacterium]
MTRSPSPARGHLPLLLIAAALLAGLVAFGLLRSGGPVAQAAPAAEDSGLQAVASAARIRTMGRGTSRVDPACPKDCEAVGRVSGFQIAGGGKTNEYRAPGAGKVVAWSVKLANPRSSQVKFFNDFYGGTPRANIQVLRAGTKNRYRMTGRSPTKRLDDHLGEEPIFVLDRPLTVRRGYQVALSTTTWVPAFATGQSSSTRWRASRPSSRCSDVDRRATHTQRGTVRTYGCTYRTARLLYTIYWVPEED